MYSSFAVSYDQSSATTQERRDGLAILLALGFATHVPGNVDLPSTTLFGTFRGTATELRDRIRREFATRGLQMKRVFVAQVSDWAAFG